MILVLTSIPNPQISGPRGTDKILHFGVYFILGILCGPAVYRSVRPSRAALLTLAAIVIFAGLDEIHQMLIPGRYANFGDWIADGAGAGTGLALAGIFHFGRKNSS